MATNQFEVFGVDVRDYGHLWLAAWRDLLFGDDSPVRSALDSQVTLRHANGDTENYQAGRRLEGKPVAAEALALPEELVLTRTLNLPAIAEADLEAALQLEVAACAPFAPDDTAAGWRIGRSADADTLTVDLAIVSRSGAMGFLGEHFAVHDPKQAEVWAQSGGRWIRLRGFGEQQREAGYRNRLLRVGALMAGAMALLLTLAWLAALLSAQELAKLEILQEEARQEARSAMALRSQLATTNTAISELNKLSRQLPNPQREIARLTALLPDSAFITQYTQNGRKIRLRGRGTEAASLQQSLTAEKAFKSVTAPQAISRVGSTGLEQFFLDIELKHSR